MKKSYTATFKAQVVLELLKETKTIGQLTSEYGVHATVLRDWKQAALKGLPDVFERRDSLTDVKATYERQLEDLYAEIGRLTTQVNFLKKKLPSCAMGSGRHWWSTLRTRSRSAPKPICSASAAGVCITSPNRHRRRKWRSSTVSTHCTRPIRFMAPAS
jgi:putative transposase